MSLFQNFSLVLDRFQLELGYHQMPVPLTQVQKLSKPPLLFSEKSSQIFSQKFRSKNKEKR